ncbi:MAG: hypothetical protein KC912_01415 [Proteobacteria bacterium]|nr:hypothetical protein [Pseudomonadota bacterium]
MWLVRPYPVDALTAAKQAIHSAAEGELDGLQALYRQARAALDAVDPDELGFHDQDHAKAPFSDKAAARAADRVAADWEGIVAVGARIEDVFRFRGFAWTAAAERYELGGSFADFVEGEGFRGVSDEDAALFVALPALVGLGPELAEEVGGACPFEGLRVAEILGLPGDVDGVDPLDGIAVGAEALRAVFPALTGGWKSVASRATQLGLLIRKA